MAVTVFEDLVLRERRDALLQVAVPQRQQRALVVEERDARGQRRHLGLLDREHTVVKFTASMAKIKLEM